MYMYIYIANTGGVEGRAAARLWARASGDFCGADLRPKGAHRYMYRNSSSSPWDLCVCVCVCVCVCIYIYVFVYIYIYTHTYRFAYMYIYMYMYIYREYRGGWKGVLRHGSGRERRVMSRP